MLRAPQSQKHVYTYLAIAVGSALLFVLTVLISEPTSITFSSKASEESQTLRIRQGASASVDVPQKDLSECVKRLSYIPESSGTSCLVSMRCTDNDQKKLSNGCSVTDNTISCYSETSCASLDEWKAQSQEMCGC